MEGIGQGTPETYAGFDPETVRAILGEYLAKNETRTCACSGRNPIGPCQDDL